MVGDPHRSSPYGERRTANGGKGKHAERCTLNDRRPGMSRAGYTLAALMIFLAILMIGLGVGFQLWSSRIQRDNEEELNTAGNGYGQPPVIRQSGTSGR